METKFLSAIPVLPAADLVASLAWWTGICGFEEVFRHGEPPSYAGINRGGARLHLSLMTDPVLARTVGDQTMLRLWVEGLDAFYEEYQQRGGKVHPNGALGPRPWGGREFGAIDPNGICVAFSG